MIVMSIEYMPVTPKPTNSRQITRKIQACSGVSAIAPVAIEVFSTVPIIALRRPTLSAAQPQSSEPNGAVMPEASRMSPDSPKVRFQSLTINASTKPIRPKSKKSSMSPIVAAIAIFHWFAVSLCCRSSASSMVSSLRASNFNVLGCPSGAAAEAALPLGRYCALLRHRCARRSYHSRPIECAVHLLQRAALGFVPEDPEADDAEKVPGREINKRGAEHHEVRRRRFDDVAGAHD